MENLKTFKSFINEAASIEKGTDGMYHPKNREELESILNQLIGERGDEGDFNDIDTSAITDMSGLFYRRWRFNGDISKWDVSNVTNMRSMFVFATSFNQPIGDWNVSNVKDMSNMFQYADHFNQDISKWNVSNVKDMEEMFAWTIDFNQPIGNWNVRNVTNMYCMFERAESFNQDISKWNTDNITSSRNMYNMFEKCPIKEEYKCIFTKIKNEIPKDDDDDEGSMSAEELRDLFSEKVYGEQEEEPDVVVLNAKTDFIEDNTSFDEWISKLIDVVTDRYGDDFTEEELKKAVYADKEFLDDLRDEYQSCKEACEENNGDN